jgi:hypothetical protein
VAGAATDGTSAGAEPTVGGGGAGAGLWAGGGAATGAAFSAAAGAGACSRGGDGSARGDGVGSCRSLSRAGLSASAASVGGASFCARSVLAGTGAGGGVGASFGAVASETAGG